MSRWIGNDQKLPQGRLTISQWTIVGFTVFLLFGFWKLQIIQSDHYGQLAERNRIRNLPVIAPRGRILDREGRLLVDNFPAFSILLMRETAATLSPARIEAIARGLVLDPAELQALVDRTAKLPRFQPIVLKQGATMDDIAFVESHRTEYPELDLIQVQQRLYPKHAIAAAMLGYVGEVSEEDIAKAGSPYRPGDVVGKSGIEKEYNSILMGRDGMRRVVVNSRGQEMGELTTVNAHPGNDLRLTIDLDLQMAAEASLGDRPGAVVALDPRTGEVLAMVSHPTFDPNDFAHHIEPAEWQQLMTDPLHPLMNKSIQAQLAPGSVFKIFIAAAALETGTIQPDFSIHCPGYVTIYGHTFHDWVFEKHRGHGAVDLRRAIAQSCDVYFYTLGKMLGIDKIAYFAKHLGLGARTGIDLPGEASGLIPSPEWVERVFKHRWWPGETIAVAIGQGAVSVTPIQLAYGIGGICLDGTFQRPRLTFPNQLAALGVDPPEKNDRAFPLSDTTLKALTGGMYAVVNDGGTGGGARCPGIEIAGKTGTAQVVSTELQQSAKGKHEFKNNAWFVGYAPFDHPEIIVTALVMQGEHSAVAAPVARDVIKVYMDKKAGRNNAAPQMQVKLEPKAAPAGIVPLEQNGKTP